MKAIHLSLGCLVAATVLMTSSCKKDLLDIQEEFDLKTSIVVYGNNPSFTGEELLDAASESDMISKYADHIKSIEVLEISYYVSAFSGPVTQQINSGSLMVAESDGSDSHLIATVQNVNLLSAAYESTLTYDQTAINKLTDLIKNDPHQAMIYLTGDVNEVPADFTVVVKFRVKMVAEVF